LLSGLGVLHRKGTAPSPRPRHCALLIAHKPHAKRLCTSQEAVTPTSRLCHLLLSVKPNKLVRTII